MGNTYNCGCTPDETIQFKQFQSSQNDEINTFKIREQKLTEGLNLNSVNMYEEYDQMIAFLNKFQDEDIVEDLEQKGKLIFRTGVSYDNGAVYHGFMSKEGLRVSIGRLEMGTLDYVGNFENDQPHGRGVMRLSDGQMQCGEFNKGMIQGEGWYLFQDGSQQQGGFKNGQREGFGMEVHSEGQIFKGHYVNSFREGLGRQMFRDGSSYLGFFKKGLKHGMGSFKWRDGKQQEGEMKNDQVSGIGQMRQPDGSEQQGEFSHERRHGVGKYIWKDKREQQGQWRNGYIHGQGISKFKSNIQFKVIYEYGIRLKYL